MSGEYTRQDFDELVARLKKLEPPTVTDCLGLVIGYTDLLAERDTLAAELVALRAGLPRWRRDGDAWRLSLGKDLERWVGRHDDKWIAYYFALDRFDTREAAMLAVTEALGLPPCEVEGE